jgi:phosphoribosylformylglycinamidine cyclo-ligase
VTGLHTNGYSLVRRIFGIGVGGDAEADRAKLNEWHEDLDATLGDALLAVHKSYYHDLKPLLERLHGFAHITGGGLIDNMPRILPHSVAARFDAASLAVPAIFRLIQRTGDINDEDMYHTFNMGVGGVLSVDAAEANDIASHIDGARVVGTIVPQRDERRVIIE